MITQYQLKFDHSPLANFEKLS